MTVLVLFCCNAIGQRIDLRNDSLFVNHYFIRNTTDKATLDSLLGSKGKRRNNISNHVYPGTDQRMRSETYTYSSKGIIFSRNLDYDTAQLSIRIKLKKNLDNYVDQVNMPTQRFKGELFIDDNYMNDKNSIEQLQKLKKCRVTYNEHTFNTGRTVIVSGNVIYQQRRIGLLFDIQTNEITVIGIE